MSLNRPLYKHVGAGLLLLVCQWPARADAIQDRVLICNQGSPCTTLDQSTTGPASASSALFGGTATGFADATVGILHAFSSYSFPAAAPISGQVNGNAQFFDQVTIDSPGLHGTTGYLVLSFAVTGNILGPANAILAPFVDCTGVPGNNCQSQTLTGRSEAVFNPIAFTFGTPVGFDFNLDAVTYYSPGGATSAVSNFRDTAALNGLGVFLNSNGTNPAPNPTFTSADGVTYSVNGIVAEPNSLPLLATGLAFLFALIHRRRAASNGLDMRASSDPRA